MTARAFDPKGLTIRVARASQGAGAPIVDQARLDDYLGSPDLAQDGVAMVRHGFTILPLSLWTTRQAERPTTRDAVTVAWMRTGWWGPRAICARARRRRNRAARIVVLFLRATPDRLLDLLFLLVATVLHWVLTRSIPAWIDRRLAIWPVRPGPIPTRETNAHRNGIRVPTGHTIVTQPGAEGAAINPWAMGESVATARREMRGFRGSFDA